MLIVLDESLVTTLDANPSPHCYAAIGIDLAAESARQGVHVLTGSVATFDGILRHQQLFNARTIALLNRARSKAAFRQALVDTVRWYVRITTTHAIPIEQVHNNSKEIELPAALVAASGTLLSKPLFITENINDALFFGALVTGFLRTDPEFKSDFSSVELRFQIVPGGGQTTAQIYSHEKAAKEHFCLAVVDSDKRDPGSDIGATAKAVRAVDAMPNAPEWNARHLVLGVRTVENMFPAKDLLNAALNLDPALGAIAAGVLAMHRHHDRWRYLPLKKGLKCYDVKASPAGEAVYWRAEMGFGQCPNMSGTHCSDRDDCRTDLVPPLGNSLLAKICEVKPVAVNIDLDADEKIVPEIKVLCVEMLTAFCGDEPMLGA